MEITYIYHSGFMAETSDMLLIMDYFRDSGHGGVVENALKTCRKQIYVLASHAHADHFSKDILAWNQLDLNIEYIFSEDLREEVDATNDNIHYILKGERYSDHLIDIKAFGSTDQGVSFLIDTGEKKLFHAGDLNNWHWNEEAAPPFIVAYERQYLLELSDIVREVAQVDVAMFPVDPRLGKDYMKGPAQFLDVIPAGYFLPMHFASKYSKANAFKDYAEKKGAIFLPIEKKGCRFSLSS